MLKERIEAARPIAEKIRAAEDACNETLKLLGELISGIPVARQAKGAHAPLTIGMLATEQLAQAVLTTSQGYRSIVAAHESLADDREQLGIKTTGFGDIFECPPKKAKIGCTGDHLRVVSNG
jgi:hypothetical protein